MRGTAQARRGTGNRAPGGSHRTRLGRGAAVVAAAAMVALSAPAAHADLVGTAAKEWWLNGSLDYSGAWSVGEGDGVTVAVIGDLADTSAPDLSGSFLPAITFPPSITAIDLNPSAPECLATEVDSLIAGHGHSTPAGTDGVVGVAPHAKILPIAVSLDTDLFANSAYTAQSIRSAVADGAKVVQIVYKTRQDAQIQQAVDYALAHGAIVVAQTGNDGPNGAPISPSDLPGVLAVAGVRQSDLGHWPQSISGPQVAVAAPADNIEAALPNGRYGVKQSTSCAAALVSGELADLWSAHPTWTAGQIERVLLSTASGHGTRIDDRLGYGVANPAAAVQAPAPAQTTSPLVRASASPSAVANPQQQPSHSATPPGVSSSSSGLVWVILGGVLGLGLIVALALFLIRRRKQGRRYKLPEPAPLINAGPSDYASYPYLADPYGQPPYPAPGYPEPGYPQPEAPGPVVFDQQGFTVDPYAQSGEFPVAPAHPGEVSGYPQLPPQPGPEPSGLAEEHAQAPGQPQAPAAPPES